MPIVQFIPQKPKRELKVKTLASMIAVPEYAQAMTDRQFELVDPPEPRVLSDFCTALYEDVTFRVADSVTLESVLDPHGVPMNIIYYMGIIIGYYETYADNEVIRGMQKF